MLLQCLFFSLPDAGASPTLSRYWADAGAGNVSTPDDAGNSKTNAWNGHIYIFSKAYFIG